MVNYYCIAILWHISNLTIDRYKDVGLAFFYIKSVFCNLLMYHRLINFSYYFSILRGTLKKKQDSFFALRLASYFWTNIFDHSCSTLPLLARIMSFLSCNFTGYNILLYLCAKCFAIRILNFFFIYIYQCFIGNVAKICFLLMNRSFQILPVKLRFF